MQNINKHPDTLWAAVIASKDLRLDLPSGPSFAKPPTLQGATPSASISYTWGPQDLNHFQVLCNLQTCARLSQRPCREGSIWIPLSWLPSLPLSHRIILLHYHCKAFDTTPTLLLYPTNPWYFQLTFLNYTFWNLFRFSMGSLLIDFDGDLVVPRSLWLCR